MKYLLTRRGRLALRDRLGTALLGFDFDGTLAPITREPGQSQMRPPTHALLTQVAARFPCVVLSGRGRDDVRERLVGVAALEVFGNHGLEPWYASAGLVSGVQRWRELLTHRLAAWPGVRIEDKTYSLAVHFRQAADPRGARQAILKALAELPEVRILGGKKVYNALPREAPHKGIALTAAMQRFSCASAIYIGDDKTDEDVFSFCDPARVLGIHIGHNRRSRAEYYLHSQTEIDELLRTLLGHD